MKIALYAAALALAAACGATPVTPAAPLTSIRLPTGLAVQDHRLLVASSNGDLLYDTDTGGSVLNLDASGDPAGLTSIRIAGALNVRSFAGELAIARPNPRFSGMRDAESCGAFDPELPASVALTAPLALFATRGSNTLNVLSIAPDGGLACEACGLSAGVGLGDPFEVQVACGAGKARAFFGYLNTPNQSETAIGLLDLDTFGFQDFVIGTGRALGLAYDRDRDRLFVATASTNTPQPLRWIDLAGCDLAAAPGAGGCTTGFAFLPTLPAGLELRSIALASPGTPGNAADPVGQTGRGPGDKIRAYVTARLYDTTSAAAAGGRTTDFGGLLIVLDLLDDGLGGVEPQVVWTVPIGRGAADVRVLPAQLGRGDVVVALSVDEGMLTIYDDETRSVASFRTQTIPDTGGPVLGHQPFGLAVDPVPLTGGFARIWTGAFADSFVTAIDVPLAAPDDPFFAGTCAPNCLGPTIITGPTP